MAAAATVPLELTNVNVLAVGVVATTCAPLMLVPELEVPTIYNNDPADKPCGFTVVAVTVAEPSVVNALLLT